MIVKLDHKMHGLALSPVSLYVLVLDISSHHIVADYGLEGIGVVHPGPTIVVSASPQGNTGHTHVLTICFP